MGPVLECPDRPGFNIDYKELVQSAIQMRGTCQNGTTGQCRQCWAPGQLVSTLARIEWGGYVISDLSKADTHLCHFGIAAENMYITVCLICHYYFTIIFPVV